MATSGSSVSCNQIKMSILGLCDNTKTYILITIKHKYYLSINDNVLIMRLCHKMFFLIQIIILYTIDHNKSYCCHNNHIIVMP